MNSINIKQLNPQYTIKMPEADVPKSAKLKKLIKPYPTKHDKRRIRRFWRKHPEFDVKRMQREIKKGEPLTALKNGWTLEIVYPKPSPEEEQIQAYLAAERMKVLGEKMRLRQLPSYEQ